MSLTILDFIGNFSLKYPPTYRTQVSFLLLPIACIPPTCVNIGYRLALRIEKRKSWILSLI